MGLPGTPGFPGTWAGTVARMGPREFLVLLRDASRVEALRAGAHVQGLMELGNSLYAFETRLVEAAQREPYILRLAHARETTCLHGRNEERVAREEHPDPEQAGVVAHDSSADSVSRGVNRMRSMRRPSMRMTRSVPCSVVISSSTFGTVPSSLIMKPATVS